MSAVSDFFRRRSAEPTLRFDRPALTMPEIGFHPPAASEAYAELFSDAGLRELQAHVDVLGLYHLNVSPGVQHVTQGDNTWERLRDLDALRRLYEAGITLSLDVEAHKPHVTRGGVITSPPPENFVEATAAAIDGVLALQGWVKRVKLDEPLCSALRLCDPPWTTQAAFEHVATYCNLLQRRYEYLEMLIAEPYPELPIDLILSEIERVSGWPGIDGLELDIDLNAVRQRVSRYSFQRDVQQAQRRCREWNLQFGVIVWGWNETNDATWVRSAEDLLAWLTDAFARDWPDFVNVQSWSKNGDHPRTMPKTLGPAPSLWSTLLTTRRVLGVPA